ncbi:hypothetical protein V8F06_005083, partial [Rhypophila decipiens]
LHFSSPSIFYKFSYHSQTIRSPTAESSYSHQRHHTRHTPYTPVVMKTFAVTLVLAALAGIDLVTASPAVRSLYVSRRDAAILSLNPNFEKDFADEHTGTAGPPGAIQRDAADAPDPNVDCPTTGNATTWGSCQDAIKYLNMIGAGAATCTAPANGCNDVYCDNTCRVAVCNDPGWPRLTIPSTNKQVNAPFTTFCKSIATDMAEIHDAYRVQRNIWHGPPDVFMGTRKWPGQYETQVSFCDGP